MKANLCNLVEFREAFSKFVKQDKKDGLKRVFYEYHYGNRTYQALDNQQQFEAQKNSYINYGFNKHIQERVESSSICIKELKNAVVIRHIFKDETHTKLNEPFDNLSLALCGYLKSSYEFVIYEIIF